MKLLYKKHRETPSATNKKIRMINGRYHADNANGTPSNPNTNHPRDLFVKKRLTLIQKSQKKPMRISKMLDKLDDLTKFLEEALGGGN